MQQTYFAFGLCIQSELSLPELPESADCGEQFVRVRLDHLPCELYGAYYRDSVLQVGVDKIQVTVKNVARLLMHAGVEIVVDPLPGASERDIRTYLLGTGLGFLCHQRSLLPLHANAIEVGGSAIAIAGHSGAGKSTLAAYFCDAGYSLLSDDVCVVSLPVGSRPLAWPGVPRLRLWKDMAEAFGRDIVQLDRAVNGSEKYVWPLKAGTPQQGLPLKRIYILCDPGSCSSGEISRLTGTDAVEAVLQHLFRSEFLGRIGGTESRFLRIVAMLARVPVFRIPWRRDFRALATEAAKLESHFLKDLVVSATIDS
jgi:hypothetical protein